jgi:hypothetical protein
VAITVAFGALFPPIAVIGLSSIVVRTGFMQFFFGRLASLSAESAKNTGETHNVDTDKDQDLDEGTGRTDIDHTTESTLQQMERKVNGECEMAGRFVYESLMSLPLLILIVWSLFLFDIAGDEVGFFQAIWIVFALGLIGILWSYANRKELQVKSSSTVTTKAATEIEMRSIASEPSFVPNNDARDDISNPLH